MNRRKRSNAALVRKICLHRASILRDSGDTGLVGYGDRYQMARETLQKGKSSPTHARKGISFSAGTSHNVVGLCWLAVNQVGIRYSDLVSRSYV